MNEGRNFEVELMIYKLFYLIKLKTKSIIILNRKNDNEENQLS